MEGDEGVGWEKGVGRGEWVVGVGGWVVGVDGGGVGVMGREG